jgi:hypothetical protein
MRVHTQTLRKYERHFYRSLLNSTYVLLHIINRFSATQEILSILAILKTHYSIHKILQPTPMSLLEDPF